jgi:hypothetical protein
MSNVRPRMRRRESAFEALPALKRCLLRCARRNGALNYSPSASAWAARPTAGSDPPAAVKGTRYAGWAGTEVSVEAQIKYNSRSSFAHATHPRSAALRSTAAPGRWFGASTGFARAGHVVVLGGQGTQVGLVTPDRAHKHERKFKSAAKRVCLYNPRPNPSIEGTSNIRLRRLSAAPHVKR